MNNPAYFNAALAGIGGAAKSAWLVDPVAADYEGYCNAVNAAALAVDSAIPTVDDTDQVAAGLLVSICFAVFLQRNVSSTTEADYAAVAASIAALFTELLTFQVLQPNGGEAKNFAIIVPPITSPDSAQVTIVDPDFIDAKTIIAVFNGPPTNTELGIQAQWVADRTTGEIAVSFIKLGDGSYAGGTESVRVFATS